MIEISAHEHQPSVFIADRNAPRVQRIASFDKGPQTPPCMILDPVRGNVFLASGQEEPFRASFNMKACQVRGMAYHKEGTATFDIVSGSFISVTTRHDGTDGEIHLLKGPSSVVVPAYWSHTFVPLEEGLIVETATSKTKDWLGNGNFVKIPELIKPILMAVDIGVAFEKLQFA